MDVKYEISAYIRKTSDVQGPALLFDNVKDFAMPVSGGVFATRKRAFLALETSNEDYVNKFQNALIIYGAEAGCRRAAKRHRSSGAKTSSPVPIFSEKGSGAVHHPRVVHQPGSQGRQKYVDLSLAAQGPQFPPRHGAAPGAPTDGSGIHRHRHFAIAIVLVRCCRWPRNGWRPTAPTN